MNCTEHELAELVTWAMCKMANGSGPGKCDPLHCVCGPEGLHVAREIYSKGYVLVPPATSAVSVPNWSE